MTMPQQDRRPLTVVSSRYRCRDHPEQPVTAKGAGCNNCAQDHNRRSR